MICVLKTSIIEEDGCYRRHFRHEILDPSLVFALFAQVRAYCPGLDDPPHTSSSCIDRPTVCKKLDPFCRAAYRCYLFGVGKIVRSKSFFKLK